jgi:hypothetical protein
MSNNDRKQEYDIFKDSPIRYLGYSNEIGEAFRPLISRRLVAFSYLIEIIYFFSDTFHKGHKAYTNIINGEDDGLIDIESFVEEYAEKKSLKDEGIKESILEYIKVEIQYVFTLEEIIVINEGNKKTYWRLKNRLN